MWILHTSDLCFTASDVQCRPLLNSLAKWVSKTTKERPIDFVVVAGNVTLDGRRESFAAAHEHLKWFCDTIVIKDPYQDGASDGELPRLVISPGHNDCGDGVPADDLTAFDEFIARITPGGASGRTAPSVGATCRQLKDITIVCVPYWTPRRAFFERLAGEWRSMQLPDSRYARYTPTVLVTAQCPTLAAEGIHPLFEPIRGLRDALEVELHLFGSGPVAALLPEPFGLDRLALGTGPKEAGTPWPFRANLLEMSYRPKHGVANGADRIYMANYVFQQQRASEPNWKDHFKGEVGLFFPPKVAFQANGGSYSSFLEELAKLISNHRRYIVVYGLPGIGKQEFIEQAKMADMWGECPVRVIHEDIAAFQKTDEDALIKRLSKELKELEGLSAKKNRQDLARRVVVLLRDRQSSDLLPSDQRRGLQRFIEQKLNKLVLRYDVSVVLLLDYLDYSLDLSGEMLPEALPLPPLTTNEMEGLIDSYASSVPIGPPGGVVAQEVSRLTGRYAGYARLILERAKGIFHDQPGIEPVSLAHSRTLLLRAMQHDALTQKFLRAIKSIEAMTGGPEVCTYIRHVVREATASGRLTGPVLLSVEAMHASAPTTPVGALTYVVNRLTQLNVIRARTWTDDEYELLLTGPFLSQHWSVMGFFNGGSGGTPRAGSTPRAEQGNGTTRERASNGRERAEVSAMKVDILLLTALPEEKSALLTELARVGRCERLDPQPGDAFGYDHAVLPLVTGKGHYSVVVASTDRGRVCAATVTAQALARWQPKYVVLVGIAGGVEHANVKVGDVLIADQVLDSALRKLYDQSEEIRWKAFQVDRGLLAAAQDWHTQFRYPARPGIEPPATHFGTVVSGDDVVARRRVADEMSKLFVRLIGFEMEAAGVAEATSSAPARPGFFMVRAVSDLADAQKDTPAIAERRSHVCEVAAAFAVQFLATGPVATDPDASGPLRSPPIQRSARGSDPPTALAPSHLTLDQQNAVAERIACSPFAVNHSERRALCRSIGVSPGLPFVESTGRSFGQELIGHLVDARNQSGIDRLMLRLVEVYVNDPVLEALMPTTRG